MQLPLEYCQERDLYEAPVRSEYYIQRNPEQNGDQSWVRSPVETERAVKRIQIGRELRMRKTKGKVKTTSKQSIQLNPTNKYTWKLNLTFKRHQ